MITLYDYELSGNCYKVRLLLSALNIKYEKEPIDFYPGKEHKSEQFLAINPLGQLPVLRDGDLILRDAQAILVYLATTYGAQTAWYPVNDGAKLGEIQQWLSFADALTSTSSAARLNAGFFYDLDVEAARAGAHQLFRVLDEHLWFGEQEGRDWLCQGTQPSIADLACFPYVMLSEEGGISRLDYPAIRRWADRFKRIPGFIVMAGIFPSGPAPVQVGSPVPELALANA